ncbi:hypothetical protein KIH45_14600, partial [Croceicoccus sp. 1NDH52]|nr:hypothetical protein [Croceicoccus gelatinilyticus]
HPSPDEARTPLIYAASCAKCSDDGQLSQEVRDRVVAAIDSGLNCLTAAARFGVSVSSAIR